MMHRNTPPPGQQIIVSLVILSTAGLFCFIGSFRLEETLLLQQYQCMARAPLIWHN
jgi:hypothetical protein